jgi:hypothetical protein
VKWVRGLGFVAVAIAVLVLGIRAGYLNLQGRPQPATSVALGVTTLMLNLLVFLPALRPPRPAEGIAQAETPPARWWNWPGRVLVVVAWLVRSALAGYAAYFVAQELDRGFSPTLLQFAVAAQVLTLLRRIGVQLSGFRLGWAGYRGWAGVRKLANAVVTAALAGYAFVVADLLSAVFSAIPRFIYRILDAGWHLPWLNIPIVIVVCVVVAIVLAVVVSWVQGLIARALGPGSALGEKLDELRIIKWEGDPRELWRHRRW